MLALLSQHLLHSLQIKLVTLTYSARHWRREQVVSLDPLHYQPVPVLCDARLVGSAPKQGFRGCVEEKLLTFVVVFVAGSFKYVYHIKHLSRGGA